MLRIIDTRCQLSLTLPFAAPRATWSPCAPRPRLPGRRAPRPTPRPPRSPRRPEPRPPRSPRRPEPRPPRSPRRPEPRPPARRHAPHLKPHIVHSECASPPVLECALCYPKHPGREPAGSPPGAELAGGPGAEPSGGPGGSAGRRSRGWGRPAPAAQGPSGAPAGACSGRLGEPLSRGCGPQWTYGRGARAGAWSARRRSGPRGSAAGRRAPRRSGPGRAPRPPPPRGPRAPGHRR